jgi:hypothetical protein
MESSRKVLRWHIIKGQEKELLVFNGLDIFIEHKKEAEAKGFREEAMQYQRVIDKIIKRISI